MNKQQVFDTVVAGARKQNNRSIGFGPEIGDGGLPETICKYRGNNGMKCFIGMLIPDDKYDWNYERTSLAFLLKSTLGDILKIDGLGYNDTYNFLIELQRIHDLNMVEKWEERFREFAQRNGVVYTPPENT